MRTEYFGDWQNINTILEGGTIVKGKEITDERKKRPVVNNRTMSTEGIKNICYYLFSETKLCELVLKRSVNY